MQSKAFLVRKENCLPNSLLVEGWILDMIIPFLY